MNHLSPGTPKKSVAIIGAGPAGLMAAEVLIQAGLKVDVYDAMSSVGRKFLMAGKGGMNITHAEDFDKFLSRYGDNAVYLKPILNAFSPEALIEWIQDLGFNTFVGSSGRVFPTDMKAAPLLRAWLHRLREQGVVFHVRHRWSGWVNADNTLVHFVTPNGDIHIKADAVVFALGGGSWARLGSTGAWVDLFSQRNVTVNPLKPANCGFETGWSQYFSERFAGAPLKAIKLFCKDLNGTEFCQQGEIMITETGVEGSSIYALSAIFREQIEVTGSALIHLDLVPDKDLSLLTQKLSQSRGKQSLANHLRKTLGIEGVKAGLLRERLTAFELNDYTVLAKAIKNLPIKLVATRPIDEAISTAGGVRFEELDEGLMIRSMPGVYCAGEMLDFDAPTGGYLLTASFATGRAAGFGVLSKL